MQTQISDLNSTVSKNTEDLIRTMKQDYESHQYKLDEANKRMMEIELDNHKVL
jgi:hypothetical protein